MRTCTSCGGALPQDALMLAHVVASFGEGSPLPEQRARVYEVLGQFCSRRCVRVYLEVGELR